MLQLIAVDGPGAAGKSTLARTLGDALGAPVLHVDDFLTWEGPEAPWVARLEAEGLRPLREGREATYRVRDWRGDELGDGLAGWRTTPCAPVVVVEGVGATRREWAGWYALRVFVDAPREVRLRRALERDGERLQARWEHWMEQEVDFFGRDGTVARADVVVRGA